MRFEAVGPPAKCKWRFKNFRTPAGMCIITLLKSWRLKPGVFWAEFEASYESVRSQHPSKLFLLLLITQTKIVDRFFAGRLTCSCLASPFVFCLAHRSAT